MSEGFAEAEVNQLQVHLIVLAHEEKIFRLEVSVANFFRVAISDGFDNLSENLPAFFLIEVLLLGDPIEELTSLADPGN